MYPLSTIRLHQIFNELDRDGDGLVTADELARLLERVGLRPDRGQLELLVGDEALGLVDFLFFYQTLMIGGISRRGDDVEEMLLERDLREAFGVFDLDGDGFISGEELRAALSRMGLWEEEGGRDCGEMIGVYDSNSDGLLDFEEFKVMMMFDSLESE